MHTRPKRRWSTTNPVDAHTAVTLPWRAWYHRMMRFSKIMPTVGLVGVMILIVTPVALALFKMGPVQGSTMSAQSKPKANSKQVKLAGFDGERAYEYLVEQCKLGPRISG